MPLTVHFFLVVASTLLLLLCSSTPCLSNQYENCHSGTFRCKDVEFSYPFGKNGSGCGDPKFQLHSCDQESNPQINISGNVYHILESSFLDNSSMYKTVRIVNDNLWGDKCDLSGNYCQFWWPWPSALHFQVLDTYTNLTLWNLFDDKIPDNDPHIVISVCDRDWYYRLSPHFNMEQIPFINVFQLPIKKGSIQQSTNYQTLLKQGFEVTWYLDPNRYQSCEGCLISNGRCGYNISKPTKFLCYCPDGSSHLDKCPDNGTEDTGTEDQNLSAIEIGCFIIGVAATTIILVVAVAFMYNACKRKSPPALQGNGSTVTDPSLNMWFANEQRIFVFS